MSKASLWPTVKKNWFWIVPIVAFSECVAHFAQVRATPQDHDWKQASQLVKQVKKNGDLIVVAPYWAEQVARSSMGNDLITLEHIARSDESAFARAIVISLGGAQSKELTGWREIDRKSAGKLNVRVLENPSVLPLVDDLTARPPQNISVSTSVNGQETPCAMSQSRVQTGFFSGTAIPGERFQCAGALVGKTILTPLNYRPRMVWYASPPGGGSAVRIKFPKTRFGAQIKGFHGLSAHYERVGPPVTISFYVDGQRLGQAVHQDGEGWIGFSIESKGLLAQEKDLTVEVQCNEPNRQYGFAISTR